MDDFFAPPVPPVRDSAKDQITCKTPPNGGVFFCGKMRKDTCMENRPKIYMAGPDVFLPDPLGMAARKKEILAAHGFEGLHPFDNEIEAKGATPQEIAQQIKDMNCSMMRRCDAILANLTPFRGPSADVGTAYEVGFMDALNKPIYAYSNVDDDFFKRVTAYNGGGLIRDGAAWRDAQQMSAENFGLFDNLMLGCALWQGIALALTSEQERYTALDSFEAAVSAMASGWCKS
ncbi:MAG: hypothetical protein DI626_03045 [Micavibrio aeruginosavorus]|uniref:Nucleoside 2-deoxyribosyltransferase n=1 Tax=Micavibrio aeruginosavorus TaxID=349221 RepID=A0A2W5A004_9BACT|nr:MAG: hypothetical protein DI626_03045 [Micavibrio aeruginosavorus]